ncbi:MAG: BrnT family toxin [Candidatus Brocadiia bacterium]
MNEMRFSWDEEKARENLRKHGVSFEEASSVFADENARVKHDPEHSTEEDRFLLLGFSARGRVLVVCHAYQRKDEVIRIITARRATRNERRQYGSLR